MKNIQVIDGAQNCVYDIFAATDEEFSLIFPNGTDIAFVEEIYARGDRQALDAAFNEFGSAGSENVMPKGSTEYSSASSSRKWLTTRQEKMKRRSILTARSSERKRHRPFRASSSRPDHMELTLRLVREN